MSLTDKQLEDMRERAEKATPGPWTQYTFHYVVGGEQNDRICSANETADAAFIAHAREDVPALLAEVDALQDLAQKVANIQIPPDERCQACHSAGRHLDTCPIVQARGFGY